MFTGRYVSSPYITQIRFVFKGLSSSVFPPRSITTHRFRTATQVEPTVAPSKVRAHMFLLLTVGNVKVWLWCGVFNGVKILFCNSRSTDPHISNGQIGRVGTLSSLRLSQFVFTERQIGLVLPPIYT